MTKQPQKPNFHKLYVTLYNNPDWLQLTALHRWLYVVLLTGSQSNSIGCYVCRLSVLSEDTGFEVTLSDMETVCKQMGIRFDNRSRTVYIPNRLKWDPPANPNVLDGMVKTACNLPKCENQATVYATVTQMVSELVFITDRGRQFVENWQEKLAEIVNGLDNGLYNLSETPYPYPLPKPQPEPYPNPQPDNSAPRSTERNAVPADLFLTYPCNGKFKEYHLPMSQVNEWSMLYYGLDVAAECKKALAWIGANPGKRKTHKGMPSFLVGWLGRANDKGGRTVVQETSSAADRAWSIIVKRLHGTALEEGETLDTPEIQAAIKAMGGSKYLSSLDTNQLPYVKKDFIAAYNQTRKQ